MKTFVSFIFRAAVGIALSFVGVISFMFACVFADEHSMWFIVAIAICIVSFIGAFVAVVPADSHRSTHKTITNAARHAAELNHKNVASL